MRELFSTLDRVVRLDTPVLIQGETGTGKELVARAIHDLSPRASGPFIVVDCAALPEQLLDAELFGHTKQAFTGAVSARAGAFEAADGGTVFLDEIGELPISMQPKLLRVIETRSLRRVGETSYRNIDVRFVAATHRDLVAMAGTGAFRDDLLFRLSVLPITVPPLRERREDIEPLLNHFLAQTGAEPASLELVRGLAAFPWRGNVRELRNFADRVRALGPRAALALATLGTASGTTEAPPALRPEPPPAPSSNSLPEAAEKLLTRAYKEFRDQWIDLGEREYVVRLLERHDRNVASAAREAELDRTYLYRLMRKHDL